MQWLRGFIWWINPRNWLGETKHQEFDRRLKAVESSVQSLHKRLNDANNAFNVHVADIHDLFVGPDAMHEPGEQIPGDGNS